MACLARKDKIEAAYGSPLVWDQLEGSNDCKIDTERFDIGSRVNPSEVGMVAFAEASTRLIDAVKPWAEEVVAEAQAQETPNSESNTPLGHSQSEEGMQA